MAWKEHASQKLSWEDLFQPAIKIATEGFLATPALIAAVEKNAPNVTNDPGLRLALIHIVWSHLWCSEQNTTIFLAVEVS